MSRAIRPRRKRDRPTGLNTTIMVDVLFILLIFFIVVSQIRTASIAVDLPEVDQAEEKPADRGPSAEPMVLTIDAADRIYLDEAAFASADELRAELQRRRAAFGDGDVPPVLVRTDQEARGARLVEVVGLLSEVGFRAIEFDVSEKER